MPYDKSAKQSSKLLSILTKLPSFVMNTSSSSHTNSSGYFEINIDSKLIFMMPSNFIIDTFMPYVDRI